MHVAITGASVGIGEALARAFAAKGAVLSLVARRKERLDAIARELSGRAFLHQADLSVPERATDWIAPAEAELGPIDVLVNNAGVQHIEPTELAAVDAGEMLLRLNVLTPLRLTRAVLPGMMARGSGAIVDIASLAAITPMPGMYYYNASKGALANASEGLRGELRGTGVHVVTVYPGPVDTDMGRKGYEKYEPTFTSKLSPVGTADELARLVVRAVERKKARVVYPRSYGVTLLFPRIARWVTSRFSPPIKRLPG
ncbi:SDR family NAD(P)-dependent oxidoreductase [Polyangium spumosum]|uniref:SDR family NAD(P)-dependent oxidoreductase n=1 Tax=Polyangium spumosum TaxID=889282 RepID=A0A6N7PN20_9BACT|nr:SDR family NAD(P)-dependent oxidoreductase [Polyangium spumosum]MRG93147.1 SDR family NAD(P)-dependent oxidoreductase [Polyangium spumosum]